MDYRDVTSKRFKVSSDPNQIRDPLNPVYTLTDMNGGTF